MKIRPAAHVRNVPPAVLALTAAFTSIACVAGAAFPVAALPAPSTVPGSTSTVPHVVSSDSSANPYAQLRPPVDTGTLAVRRAGPSGQLNSSKQASEIRWVFDRPVVELSAIEKRPDLSANLVTEPKIEGSFRWASTRILIFTPAGKLPRSTSFTVRLSDLKAVDGSPQSTPSELHFDTPRVRCDIVGSNDKSLSSTQGQLAVRCTQPVSGSDVAAHVMFISDRNTIDSIAFTPDPSDLAAMRAADATAADALIANIDRLTKPAQLPDHRARFVRTAPCPDNDKLKCLWVTADEPLDHDASVRVAITAGIASGEGPLPSEANAEPFSANTASTPLFGATCRRLCPVPEDRTGVLVARGDFDSRRFSGKVRITDTSGGEPQIYRWSEDTQIDPLSLQWAKIQPGHTYRIGFDADITSRDGDALGAPLFVTVGFGPRQAYVDSPTGEAIKESALGSKISLNVRNVTGLEVVTRRLNVAELSRLHGASLATDPATDPFGVESMQKRTVPVAHRPDEIQTIQLDLGGQGFYLVAVRATGYEPNSAYELASDPKPGDARWSIAVLQVSDLAVTLKRSPTNVLVAVTSYTTGSPVGGVDVELVAVGSSDHWKGTVGADGLATAPGLNCADSAVSSCELLAIATKGSDTGYTSSDWLIDGRPIGDIVSERAVAPAGSIGIDAPTSSPAPIGPKLAAGERLVAALFTDRGVYKGGEEVHVRGQFRIIAPRSVRIPQQLTAIPVVVRDDRGVEAYRTTVQPDTRGGFDVVFSLAGDPRHGTYSVVPEIGEGATSFLVTAFRRPDFQVDVAIAKPDYTPGDQFSGTVNGKYLFGEPMRDRDVRWTLTSNTTYVDPTTGHPELGLRDYSWSWICVARDCAIESVDAALAEDSNKLDTDGNRIATHQLAVRRQRHSPATVTLEGIVTNVDRQVIANRATATVHVGEYYLGVRAKEYFAKAGVPISASVAALTPAGAWHPDATVKATLIRWEWPDDFNSNPKPVEVGTSDLTSTSAAVPVSLTPNKGGSYELRVESTDSRGNHIEAGTWIYVLDKNANFAPNQSERIEITPSREVWRIGETAEMLVKNPWPAETGIRALVTVEREEVMSAQWITFDGAAAAVRVPITDVHVPNLQVSVTAFKGRTSGEADVARPAVRTGSTMLRVPPEAKTLAVTVTPGAKSYRPGDDANAVVALKDAAGHPTAGRITLWAVDEGILRLTGFSAPSLLDAFWSNRPVLVSTADPRPRLAAEEDRERFAKKAARSDGGISADTTAAPAADEALARPAASGFAAQEQAAAGPDAVTVRSDFRVLATWQGSIDVGASGQLSTAFKLPQSLSSYRIIAVADSGNDLFGAAVANVDLRLPFAAQPALPRFANIGDTFEGGAVLQNVTGKAGTATLTLKLDADSPVTVDGPLTQTITLQPGPTEVRFKMRATTLGVVRGTLTARLGSESDAVRVEFPVLETRRLETVAASGVVDAGGPPDTEVLRLPDAIRPELGGLDVAVSSSALAGLQNGVAELVEYPYGCLEQRSSRLRVLLMLSNLRKGFGAGGSGNGQDQLPGLAGEKLDESIVAELARIAEYRTSSGGLSYWPGDELPDVFLTARVLVLMLDAKELGFEPPAGLIESTREYLRLVVSGESFKARNQPITDVDGVWLNRGHLLYALARAGLPQPKRAARLWNRRDELSILEQVHLLHALVLSGDTGERPGVLYREILNSVRDEADQSFAQDDRIYGDDNTNVCPCMRYLWWGGDTPAHDTAAVLSLLVKVDPKDPTAAKMARWLLAQRNAKGTWENTLENGYALTSLVDYYRAAEADPPQERAQVLIGAITAFEGTFSGRSLAVQNARIPMAKLATTFAKPNEPVTFTVKATGTGRVHWIARLRYAPAADSLAALAAGFTVTREYVPLKGGGATTSFRAGDLVSVKLHITTAQARRNVAIDDAIPAGLEPLNAELTSTARTEIREGGAGQTSDVWSPGIDHVEIHDERVLLFATQLSPGTLDYTYVARATAPGTFRVAPAQAEEMYRPEIFGRSASALVTITP